jgi:tRNA-modifying protein YgfZ
MPAPTRLSHRAIISVSGEDAEAFLNGLLTMSASGMAPADLRYGALLTPQGKIIADMLLMPENLNGGGEFLIDCDSGVSANLLKRLNMFRLRAKVSITERPDLCAIAFDGAPDPRSELAPLRRIASRNAVSATDAGEYHAHRIAAGLAEQGIDFASEDVFPADINMDLVGGIDFKKGCFVGQEVVSRMKRRGNARRRTLKARVAADISVPAPVLAGDFEIGTLTSISGGAALARLRIDRLAEAQAKGEPITASGQPITFDNPTWLASELAALKEAKPSA